MLFSIPDLGAAFSSVGTSFLLIFLAEFGDKSQLVCMTLAARHRGLPVILGAASAFAILNLLAVLFGSALASWLPEWFLVGIVTLLFAYFGVQALRFDDDEDDELPDEKQNQRSIYATTFLMILFAEFGDKTQLAVAGLSGVHSPTTVWIGASLALVMTTVLGVVAGQQLIKRLSLKWIHRCSGVLFLALAVIAGTRLVVI